MAHELVQLHFRKFSNRGPLSAVLLYGDEDDVLTVFWEDLGFNPENETEADYLLANHLDEIVEEALNPDSVRVEKGVLRDPNSRVEWQKNVVYKLRKKAGV